jgi:hypothetical protein
MQELHKAHSMEEQKLKNIERKNETSFESAEQIEAKK